MIYNIAFKVPDKHLSENNISFHLLKSKYRLQDVLTIEIV